MSDHKWRPNLGRNTLKAVSYRCSVTDRAEVVHSTEAPIIYSFALRTKVLLVYTVVF